MREIARARPLLGTVVEIRAAGLAQAAAIAAIERAFAEVEVIHRCMSFHETHSDLSRLHRARSGRVVEVDARTGEVLRRALEFAQESDGCFDPVIAAELVDAGFLPRPTGARLPDARADWRDIELIDERHVRLHRSLWIDLGGIAKGFAVDRAIAILREAGASMACVNAGGDLRRFGASAETVALQLAADVDTAVPMLEIIDGAVATSATHARTARIDGRVWGVHIHGRSRKPVRGRRAVSVVAASCCTADALTKVMLADLRTGKRLLRRHQASACLHDEGRGWRMFGDS